METGEQILRRGSRGAFKPLFAGSSDHVVAFPIAPREAPASAKALGRKPKVHKGSTTTSSIASCKASEKFAGTLHEIFCNFQVQANSIDEHVKATQTPVDSTFAEGVLSKYIGDVGNQIRAARDGMRRGRWDIDHEVRTNHDNLCFCLAIWELTYEVAVNSAPCSIRLLHWYTRHYLEEDITEWVLQARQHADDPAVTKSESSPFWEALCHLALCDRRVDVLNLLQRLQATSRDDQIARFLEFLQKFPSLEDMDLAQASDLEHRQCMHEMQVSAQSLMQSLSPEHPIRQLCDIYAGCSQENFEANKDPAAKWSKTWIEDFVYSFAWIFPSFRRDEMVDLLQVVSQRNAEEPVDDVDRLFFEVLSVNVPTMLEIVTSQPYRFPTFFVTHLVDVLYFAGRVPQSIDAKGQRLIPPRDMHLMAYAQELSCGSRACIRYAIDYLRAGSSEILRKCLLQTVDQYCGTAVTDNDLEAALCLLVELNLGATLGVRMCRQRAMSCRLQGDIIACLRWGNRAETYTTKPEGFYVSELLDAIAQEDLEGLLRALTPTIDAEPLNLYPHPWLVTILAPSGPVPSFAPSGRLYFYAQYARCRALRMVGMPPAGYAPTLLELLSTGVAEPSVAQKIIEEDLMPVLQEDTPVLNSEQVLLLMRYVQTARKDPMRRTHLKVGMDRLHQALGSALSVAFIKGPDFGNLQKQISRPQLLT